MNADNTIYLGGMDVVMEQACRGARSAGGVTLGILPGRLEKRLNKCIKITHLDGFLDTLG